MNDQPRIKPDAKTCIVMLHDLLGFGNLVASSSGTLDSAVGEIAYNRICNLRESFKSVHDHFPTGSKLIHFNDTACASLDINISIGSQLIDPSGIGSTPPGIDEIRKIFNFLGASSKLHQKTLSSEEEYKLGPGARTIVVIGKRWKLDDETSELDFLQANLAFSEAYIADSLGSKVGLNNRCFYNLYVNDYLWFVLEVYVRDLPEQMQIKLNSLGMRELNFPKNLRPVGIEPAKVNIFHRNRMFYSLMSHHACSIEI